MEPSSLVFLAIIGVWAAYLIPTRLRRRIVLAQSRARDRFSTGARVLDRRPSSKVPGAVHRSASSVHRTRPAGGPSFEDVVRPPSPARSADARPRATGKLPARRPSMGEADRARARSAQREAQLAHAAAVERARLAALRRARVMLALLLLTAAAWLVTVLTVASAWVAAPITAMLVLHTVAGRLAAIRSKQTLAASRTRLAEARWAAEAAATAPSPGRRAAAEEARAEAEPAEPAPAPVAETPADDTWTPVPVPPPAYTLKPPAPRPDPAPLPEDETARPAARATLPRRAEDVERILDLEPLEERRAVNG